MRIVTDADGKWHEIKGAKCVIRLLVEPSQLYLDSLPPPQPEPSPPRDALAEIDSLKAEMEILRKS